MVIFTWLICEWMCARNFGHIIQVMAHTCVCRDALAHQYHDSFVYATRPTIHHDTHVCVSCCTRTLVPWVCRWVMALVCEPLERVWSHTFVCHVANQCHESLEWVVSHILCVMSHTSAMRRLSESCRTPTPAPWLICIRDKPQCDKAQMYMDTFI